MATSLRIGLWNANGLIQHKDELTTFLNLNKIDVMLISETHFTERTYLKIPYYEVYHTEYPDGTAHGGSAIIIKQTISHHELEKHQDEFLQATTIQIKGPSGPFVVSAVYCPPRHRFTKDKLLPFFDTLGPRFLVGGDYNAKHTDWGSRLITTRGRELFRVIAERNYLHMSSGTPTYWPSDPNKIPDLLDFFIANGISNNYAHVEPSYDLSSDHSPVIATLSTTVILKENHTAIFTRRTDWDAFREYVEQNLEINVRLKTTEELERTTNHLIQTLQKAGWHATPFIERMRKTQVNVPLNVKRLVAQKRKARAKWQRTHNILDKRTYNHLSNLLKRNIREIKNQQFETYLSTLTRDDNSIWKAAKSFKRPKIHIPPIRNQTDQWARSDTEKSNVFAHYLAEVFHPHSNEDNAEVEEYLTAPLQLSLPIKAFSPLEIIQEIKYLNSKKAPGYDLITGKALKELPRKGIILLTILFNAILRLTYWPLQLKFAQIFMILKPGKPPNEVTSYRPISLLSVISKLLEKLILKRIHANTFLEQLLPHHQFGFRHEHSTIQQCHRLVDVINKAMEDKKYCCAVFLDAQQAFDKVWYQGLLFKIKKSFPHQYFLLLKSYLADRYFQVKSGCEVSDIMPINSGVPQGSVLGPLLYLIYTADLPTSENTVVGTFADDTAILSCHEDPQTASHHVQDHISSVSNWLTNWRLKVNESKSVQVTFTLRRQQCPPISINGIEIQQSKETRYLGMHMDNKLTWKTHIGKKRKEMDLKVKKLYWLMGRNSRLSCENKILLYKTIIKPIWTYGIELWGCSSSSNVDVLQRFQSKTLRAIVDAPWYVSNRTLHEDLRIPYVNEVIHHYMTNHMHKLQAHPNPTIRPLLDNTHRRRLRRKWTIDSVTEV